MSEGPHGHDAEVEALIVDRYLESLLSRRPADRTDIPPGVEVTARRLAAALPRFHPSFRFEEELSARLRAAAAGPSAEPTARPAAGRIVRFPLAPATMEARPSERPDDRPADRVADRERAFAGRPAVLGGVLTSAALSLAGAAFVAWRLRRPPFDPMTRAARAASRVRVA